jgi:GNAT superfamily N-acetyltransferase
MATEIRVVDYADASEASQLVGLLNHYACDPMGGGQALPQSVQDSLVDELRKRPSFKSAIAWVDEEAAALVNFAEGFSTFAAKPLINVHDLVVHADFRGQGLSHKLLEFVRQEAAKVGCCKLTLEVLSENEIARSSYRKFGFKPYQLSDEGGAAQFWQMKLSVPKQ